MWSGWTFSGSVDYISIMMMMCLVTHLNTRSAACHGKGPVTLLLKSNLIIVVGGALYLFACPWGG